MFALPTYQFMIRSEILGNIINATDILHHSPLLFSIDEKLIVAFHGADRFIWIQWSELGEL